MFFVRNFLCFIALCSVNASFQINLDLTNVTNDKEGGRILQHDCLHVAAWMKKETDPYQIISYCISEWPSKWNVQKSKLDQSYTFAQLLKENITSQQLYLWSAPIDIIEHYQFYLNHISTSNSSLLMTTELFYNCTLPFFGPQCQYSILGYINDQSSLSKIIYDYYQNEYDPPTLTCYVLLECDRGSPLLCLDWSEICDGVVDCRNGIDEEFCWQLEINECEDNEDRCENGQCLQKTFFRDNPDVSECLDRSDEKTFRLFFRRNTMGEPTFANEDVVCPNRTSHLSPQLTSSCWEKRSELINELMLSDKSNTTSNDCWLIIICQLDIKPLSNKICRDLSFSGTPTETINQTCPNMLFIPAGPVAFGHMYFLYEKQDLFRYQGRIPFPRYVCYNDQLCGGFHSNQTLLSFHDTTCRNPNGFPLTFGTGKLQTGQWNIRLFLPLYKQLYRCNTVLNNGSISCDSKMMYRCINSSKCISKHRICDGLQDCDYNDDEQCASINGSCSTIGFGNLFKCITTDLCISMTRIENNQCDCGHDKNGLCDDEDLKKHYIKKHISFTTICDGYNELTPVSINGHNETDETECQYWRCNNTYTRCDGYWNCFNGADEVDCDPIPESQCPLHHHMCVSSDTSQSKCLNIDCFGAIDEPQLCRSTVDLNPNRMNIDCINDDNESCTICRDECYNSTCQQEGFDKFCNKTRNSNNDKHANNNHFVVEKFNCNDGKRGKKPVEVFFSLGRMNNSIKENPNTIISSSSFTRQIAAQHEKLCHRGLALQIWLDKDKNVTTITCLCPSNYYGNLCQYENERVSLTLKFETYSDSRRTQFAIIVLLIDNSNERIIHSHQQFSYLSVRDCEMKFNMYLLYLTQPKDQKRNYSIHIDVYKKVSLEYRTSFIIPIKFSFLPVYRLALQLTIPRITDNIEHYSNQPCIHGQYIKYSNDLKEITFCQCNQGWSGEYCNISHNCTCSFDSLCIGILPNKRSLCVCPINKWGPECRLENTICNSDQNSRCLNNGECIPTDQHVTSSRKFKCICQKGFSGDRCEIIDNKLILSFDKNIILSKTILVHFIEVINNDLPINVSTFVMIPINQRTITISWSYPFHIAFVQVLNKSYYLIIVRQMSLSSTPLVQHIKSSDRCPYIDEVLNETIVKYHLLRRIKYYHFPCEQHSPQLSCFYDENYFCLCNDYGQQRIANCFQFNYTKKFDCFGKSDCQHGAQCLQDRLTCPQTSICLCPECFHGKLCQFPSNLIGLSLDAILGYHIQPDVDLKDQSIVIQISITLTIIMTVLGLVNSILSMITFKNKEPRKIGCGIYLMSSSIVSLFITILFSFKFWILIIAQMTSIRNQFFLQIQCISLDFLVRISLQMNQWLSVCVAIERVIVTIKGICFNSKKSKQIAKYIILILFIFNMSTSIHDPINRRLIDDDNFDGNEKRIWCIVTYSSIHLRTFNKVMNLFHFLTPFVINFISALSIIIITTRQRTAALKQTSYRKNFFEQFRQLRHTLITPIALIILGIPRLIISFVSGCMTSMDQPWLPLFGYLISFIPSMLTFVVFVLPSTAYKQEFQNNYQRYKRAILIRLHLIS